MSETPPVEHNESERRFEIVRDGQTAYLSYEEENGALALTHTIVPEPLAGRGLAGALAGAAFAHARARGARVIVVCSYVAKWVARHPQEAELVIEDRSDA